MTDQAQFRTAFRGYEPADVDSTIAHLRKAVENGNAELGRVTVEAENARTRASESQTAHRAAAQRIAELEGQLATVGRPTYEELGQTVGRILTLAEQEAKDLRSKAKADAAALLASATAQAEAVRDKAGREASERLSSANADAARVLEDAKRKADEIIDHADRESTARLEEAEAVYEHQRMRATAAAADFEQTLAGRRDAAAAEFEGQLTAHGQQLAASTARRDAAETEATHLLEQANQQARSQLSAAHEEATRLVSAARAQADRIRTDSSRELAAATQRRDAITAQLTNVRQMLATLGQGAGAALALDVAPEPRPVAEPSGPADESAADSQNHAEAADAEAPVAAK
jgi:cell division septum initiation protein DivIVA